MPLSLLSAVWEGELDPHLRELMRLEFLHVKTGGGEPLCAFTHSLTREVAYESLPPARRRALHGAIARALEASLRRPARRGLRPPRVSLRPDGRRRQGRPVPRAARRQGRRRPRPCGGRPDPGGGARARRPPAARRAGSAPSRARAQRRPIPGARSAPSRSIVTLLLRHQAALESLDDPQARRALSLPARPQLFASSGTSGRRHTTWRLGLVEADAMRGRRDAGPDPLRPRPARRDVGPAPRGPRARAAGRRPPRARRGAVVDRPGATGRSG